MCLPVLRSNGWSRIPLWGRPEATPSTKAPRHQRVPAASLTGYGIAPIGSIGCAWKMVQNGVNLGILGWTWNIMKSDIIWQSLCHYVNQQAEYVEAWWRLQYTESSDDENGWHLVHLVLWRWNRIQDENWIFLKHALQVVGAKRTPISFWFMDVYGTYIQL